MTEQFRLNGDVQAIPERAELLVDLLRQELNLTGTKAACREGDCGSCQVLVKFANQQSWSSYTSCLLRSQDIVNSQVLTVESLPENNPIIETLAAAGVSQCGFCSPGLVISAIHWLLNGETLTKEEGILAINSNLCRCTGYMGQRRAIESLSHTYQEDLLICESREHYLIEKNILPACDSALSKVTTEIKDAPVNAPLIAGGTDLYLQQNIEQLRGTILLPSASTPAVIVSNEIIALSAKHSIEAIEHELNELGLLPSFKEFTESFASPLIRRRATLGGNLAHASPVGDGICYILALQAKLETNQRTTSIEDFYTGFKQTCLQTEEVIEWIHIPKTLASNIVLFEKVGRRQTCDIAVLNCCGVWQITQGQVSAVSLVMGGASPIPVRFKTIEKKLIGLSLAEDIDQEVFDLLDASISPISDVRGSERYRRALARQLLVSQWHRLSESNQVLAGDANG